MTYNNNNNIKILFCKIAILITLLAIKLPVSGFELKKYTVQEGLSDNTVRSIYQDEHGTLWFGTRHGGLNLYNGNNFKAYKYQKGYSKGLDSNNIFGITGNQNGHIYILTTGVMELDIKTGNFKRIFFQNANAIYFNKTLYVGTERKLYRRDKDGFKEIYELPADVSGISTIGVDNGEILIGTKGSGVFCLKEKSQLAHVIESGNITSMFLDREGRWWIGSWKNGLYIMENGCIKNLRHSKGNESPSSDFVRSFCQDKDGNIWIGTFNGLNIYNPQTGTFTYHTDKNGKSKYTSVWSLLCDHQGNVWIGTYFDGVYYCITDKGRLKHWKHSYTECIGLSSDLVKEFAEDNNGNVWIATEGGGLNMLPAAGLPFKWYLHNSATNSISHNNINALHFDTAKNTLWVGTHLGGLDEINFNNKKIRNHRHATGIRQGLISDNISDIMPYDDKLLITTDKGLCLFSPADGTTSLLFDVRSKNFEGTRGTMLDNKGNIWIYGGGYGVYVYNPNTKKLRHYWASGEKLNNVSGNEINFIFQDSKNSIWLCNNKNGIDLYRSETDDFINLDKTNNKLASNTVYKAIETPTGKILFTTDAGFSILDKQSMTFSNYGTQNGIPFEIINDRALYITKNGNILIGGNNGFITFREEDLDVTPEGYRIVPFSLSIHGKDNKKKDCGTEQIIFYPEEIILKSSQSMFSIEYITSDYISNDEKNLEYFLKGQSEHWTSIDGHPVLTFASLSPGKYTLLVRPKNNFMETAVSSIDITMLPPFYMTWWAFLLYFISGGTIIYIGIRRYKSHVHLVEELKYEQKKIADVEELSKAKIRFFTNISHEFRTPLTLINGNMELLLSAQSFPPAVYNRLLGIYKSGQELNELITELLDFSKLESGHMKIKASEQNIVKFAYENYLLFKEYAAYKNITFDFVKTDDTINVFYDSKQMQKVLNNLLSNAFKYTPKGGKIALIVRKDNGMAVLEVKDSGEGIPANDLDKIFDRFYQSQHKTAPTYTGTGIGLSLTKGIVELHHGKIDVYSHEGATFRVFLKLGNGHFTQEELTDIPEETTQKYPFDNAIATNLPEMEPNTEIQEKSLKILIAEDNAELREMLIKIFTPTYITIAAEDGVKAWEKVQKEMPDIVVSDVIMPEMSGTELCRAIKNNTATNHIPVVLLTARTTVQQNLEGLYSGADDYISKPFNINILTARCNNLINNRLMLKEKFAHDLHAAPVTLTSNPLDQKLIDQICKFIEGHIDDIDLNANSIISEIGISRTKLFTKLKSITGQTPADFILTVRLKKAAIMLMERPELNISEISDQLGFSSPRQFSKSFKERYGTIPQQWRKTGNAINT